MAGKLLTSPLNRIPEGLLDFFQIKSMGENPQSLLPDLRGVLDLTRWYSDTTAEEGTALLTSLAASAPTSVISIASANWLADGTIDFARGGAFTQVPNGEVWLVLEATMQWAMSSHSGHSSTMVLTSARVFGSNQQQVITDSQVGWQSNLGTTGMAGYTIATKPFWLLPGSVLQVNNLGTVVGVGGTVTPRVTVRLKRLSR